MKTLMFIGLLVLIVAGKTEAQTDSLVDVFPLAVGNQWTYKYFTIFEQNGGPGILTITDSGSVVYSVVGMVRTADSTRWMFRARRDLIHHRSIPDSTFPVRDSSTFELVERHEAQHHLYRNENPNTIQLDVFPFTREFTDTTRIYRLRNVGLGDTTTFKSAIPRGFPNPLFRSTFTYRKSVGQIRFRYNSGVLDATYAAEHVLIGTVITSADKSEEPTHPVGFLLYQNYPNPFNPTTTVSYVLGQRSSVTLKIFDLLGKEVATLVDEIRDAGYEEAKFDASRFAGGVYFYRLDAGGDSRTKRMVLLK